MFDFLKTFFDEKQFFLATVEVASYLPGRIRCYSSLIHNNSENSKLLQEYFGKFSEITSFKINPSTGSILIEYDVDNLRKNKELVEIEAHLKKKAKK